MGFAQIAIAIVFGVIEFASTPHPLATAVGLTFGAAFYGGFMWWLAFGRLRRDVETAPVIVDPPIRDERRAARSLVLGTTGLVAVFAALTVWYPRLPILAGIALGGGADGFAFHRWLVRWEGEHVAEVLRVPGWRRRRGINTYRITRTTSD